MNQKQITKSLADNLLVFIEKVHDKDDLDKELLNVILQEFQQLTFILKENKKIPKEIAML